MNLSWTQLEPRDGFHRVSAHQAQTAELKELWNMHLYLNCSFSSARSKIWSSVPSLPVPGISLHNLGLFCRVMLHWGPAEVLRGKWGLGSVLVIQNELNPSIFWMSQGSWVCCCSSSRVLHKLVKIQDLFLSQAVDTFPVLAVLDGHLFW